ncbi:hypothetical protein [Leptospira sp. 'Mane']|uniref:hypothetical protein n=1 Tax=Leptospira sp. 'Mane' TaxID=3387407 RepID=UPI00398B190B
MIFKFFTFGGSKKDFFHLDSSARERLEREKIKDQSVVGLEIRIDRNLDNKGFVFVGFSQKFNHLIEPNRTKIQISDKDLRDLDTGYLSYSADEGSFLYYPEISIDWENTPRQDIKRITSNKHFTLKGSEWIGEKNTKTYDPIRKILSRNEVVSLFAKDHMMQIEFSPAHPTLEEEEEIADLLLIYLSSLFPNLNEPLQNLP